MSREISSMCPHQVQGEPAWKEVSQYGDHWFELLAYLGSCLGQQVSLRRCPEHLCWARLQAECWGVWCSGVCLALMELPCLERGQAMHGYDTNKQLWMFKYGSQVRDKELLSTIKEASETRSSRRDESCFKGWGWAPFVCEAQELQYSWEMTSVSAERSWFCFLFPFSRF